MKTAHPTTSSTRASTRRRLVLWLGLACSGACGSVTSPDDPQDGFVDQAFEGQFGAGQFSGTRWLGNRIELEDGRTSGGFVSRVFDAGTAHATWQSLTWDPGAPYAKPLPGAGSVESGYRTANLDMRQNVLLVHFDGALTDDSPAHNTLESTSLGGFAPGVFGSALQDDRDGYVHSAITGAESPFSFGTDSFTFSLWAKLAAPCTTNEVYLGAENSANEGAHLWLGCQPGANGTAVLGNAVCATRFAERGDCKLAPGSDPLTPDRWHHLVLVKSGHAPATLTSYQDGKLQNTTAASYLTPIAFSAGVELAVGALSRGTFAAQVALDEVAAWRRALDASEIAALYRRGAHRLSIQVRACDEPTCRSVPFAGPGGDPVRSFSAAADRLAAPEHLPIHAVGRYFQYQLHLESDEAGKSPALFSIGASL